MTIPYPTCGWLARGTRAFAIAAILAGTGIGPAMAQGLFSPAIRVNETVVTQFELDQRTRLMSLLRAPGDPARLAREALIDDRLKQQAVKEAGISVTPEDVQLGIEEFAGRTELSADEFLKALAAGGVQAETMRDFTEVSLAWRNLIQERFLAKARPTAAEIDRALGQTQGGGVQVLLSEIIIPVTPQTVERAEALAEELSRITSQADFAAAAERYSAAQTRTNGGRMDWLSLGRLPAGLQPVLLELAPGEVTDPIALPDAVALFQMRGIRETAPARPSYSAIDYATYLIPGGRTPDALARAGDIIARVDRCDDLYGINKDLPPELLERHELPPGKIPRDVALELAKLDNGEISTALTRSNGQTLMLVMMCNRTAALNEEATREQVANALTQQRLSAFSDSYLEQLRADALIVEE
nr:peptidylprolyl isomerase [Pukyongiella litopenaei]